MSDKIYVATRKGLFMVQRSSAGKWAIAGSAFIGDPVTMLLDDRRDGTLYAALNLDHFGVKLHRSENGGGDWSEIQAPAFAPQLEEKLDATPSSPSVHQV